MVFKFIVFLELTLTQNFLFCGFIWCSFLIFSYFVFSSFGLSIESVWSVLSFVFLIALSWNVTIRTINITENFFRLEYQLSMNSWSKFPTVTSKGSSEPFATSFFWCIGKKNYVKNTLLMFLSIGSVSLLIHSCCGFDSKLANNDSNISLRHYSELV